MNPTPGTRLDHYEIIETIGRGGMGEVYRARDTRLPRETAIKVSSERFSERFAREAHVIASLNHPNITTLYDVGPDYLVMELVEGATLADRIRQGPLTLDEASAIARQIADALDYAHDRGVVHRDLKPGNVKIRPDGVVKVLDFGLAKSGVGSISSSDDSPTITTPQTEAGMVLGTAAYMSPEQARGQDVDKRADIWAFGCVFYEMLTGAPPYQGDTSQETMASILRDEPDLQKVPAPTRRLLKRCLEKDPQKRLRHIGDVMSLLDEPASGHLTAVVAPSDIQPIADRRPAQWLWPAVAAATIVIAGGAVAVWAPWRSRPPVGEAVRFEVAQSDKMKFFFGGAMAVSPDGHWLVFPATGDDGVSRYWLRSLDTVEASALPGTETAYVPAGWSADSQYVIFSPLNSSWIKKVDIHGGPSQTVTEMVGRLNGVSVNSEGVILFGSSARAQPIFRASISGGASAEPITVVADGESGHKWPQFLPDGRHFLYFKALADPNRAGVYVGSLDAKPGEQSTSRLLATNRQAYYSPSGTRGPGRLIFVRDATLMAQTFDPVRMELSGAPVPVAAGVASFPIQSYGLFSVSDSGTLVYRGGAGSKLAVTLFDERGQLERALVDPGDYADPVLSPDQTRIAVTAGTGSARDIWLIDAGRETTTRFTFDAAADSSPVWSPDGKFIAFASSRSGHGQMYVKPADGSSEERLLADVPGTPTSWSKDGRFLLFTQTSLTSSEDLWVLPDPLAAAGTSKPFPFLATPFGEQAGQFSPDGRWVAYEASDPAGFEVYVRPFASVANAGASGAKWLVSQGVSGLPRWRADGKQLLFVGRGSLDILGVDIDTSKGFQAGAPRRLVTAPPPLTGVGWDVAPDGKRFVFVTTPDGGRPPPFTVVVNWAQALPK